MTNYFMPHVVKIGENKYIYRKACLLNFFIYLIPIFGWIKFLIDYNKQYSNPIFRFYLMNGDGPKYVKYPLGQTLFSIEDIYNFELRKKSKKVLSFKDVEKEYSIKQLQK